MYINEADAVTIQRKLIDGSTNMSIQAEVCGLRHQRLEVTDIFNNGNSPKEINSGLFSERQGGGCRTHI